MNNSFSGLFFRTLYCAKGNYDFGISRVIKSLEPYNKKVHHFNLSSPCLTAVVANVNITSIKMQTRIVQSMAKAVLGSLTS